jgi:hypothetical protein
MLGSFGTSSQGSLLGIEGNVFGNALTFHLDSGASANFISWKKFLSLGLSLTS